MPNNAFLSRQGKNQNSLLRPEFCEEGFLGGRYEGLVRPFLCQCRAGINIAGIRYDGLIGACPEISQYFDQGDIRKERLKAVWEERLAMAQLMCLGSRRVMTPLSLTGEQFLGKSRDFAPKCAPLMTQHTAKIFNRSVTHSKSVCHDSNAFGIGSTPHTRIVPKFLKSPLTSKVSCVRTVRDVFFF